MADGKFDLILPRPNVSGRRKFQLGRTRNGPEFGKLALPVQDGVGMQVESLT